LERFCPADLMTCSRNTIVHYKYKPNLDLENWAETSGRGSSASHNLSTFSRPLTLLCRSSQYPLWL